MGGAEIIFTVALKHITKAHKEGKPEVAERLVEEAISMLEAVKSDG